MRAINASTLGVLTGLATSCFAAPVQAAAGLEPGVHADPGSPAAKQYALPLEQARRAGMGTATRRSSSDVPFGTGIKPGGSGGARRRSASRGNGNGNGNGGATRTPRSKPDDTPTGSSHKTVTLPGSVLRSASSRASGDGSLLALLAGAAAVLILGGLGGTLVQRRHRSMPSV
jgi:hypothetical protein